MAEKTKKLDIPDFKDKNSKLYYELNEAKQEVEKALAADDADTRMGKRRINKAVRQADSAMYALIEANRALIRKVANKFTKQGSFPQEDAEQEATVALIGQLRTWDPNRGALSTHAVNPMSKAVKGIVASMEHGMSVHGFSQRGELADTVELLKEAGKKITPDALAEESGIPRAVVVHLQQRRNAGHDRSLDAPVGDANGATVGELLATPEGDTVDDLSEDYLLGLAADNVLSAFEFAALVLSGGLAVNEVTYTSQQIAELFGVSREIAQRWMRRVEAKIEEEHSYISEETTDEDWIDWEVEDRLVAQAAEAAEQEELTLL